MLSNVVSMMVARRKGERERPWVKYQTLAELVSLEGPSRRLTSERNRNSANEMCKCGNAAGNSHEESGE